VQLFGFRFAASVAFQFQANGLADLASDGEQDALAEMPNGWGIGQGRLLATVGSDAIRFHASALRRGERLAVPLFVLPWLKVVQLAHFGGLLLRFRHGQLAGLDEGKDGFDVLAMTAVGVALASAAVVAALPINQHVIFGRFALDLLRGEFLEMKADSEVCRDGLNIITEMPGFLVAADNHVKGEIAVDGLADGNAAGLGLAARLAGFRSRHGLLLRWVKVLSNVDNLIVRQVAYVGQVPYDGFSKIVGKCVSHHNN
jgi:hypothetical protein